MKFIVSLEDKTALTYYVSNPRSFELLGLTPMPEINVIKCERTRWHRGFKWQASQPEHERLQLSCRRTRVTVHVDDNPVRIIWGRKSRERGGGGIRRSEEEDEEQDEEPQEKEGHSPAEELRQSQVRLRELFFNSLPLL